MTVLTPEQITFFRTFGYLALPGLLNAHLTPLEQAFEALFLQHSSAIVPWDSEVHAHRPRQILPQPAEKHPFIANLYQQGTLPDIARTLLGDNIHPSGSDANRYDCGTRWHADIIGLPYDCMHIKCLLYLDSMRAGEDAFRVIPGSQFHTSTFSKALKEHIKTPDQSLGLSMTDIPAVEIPTEPGDVVIIDVRIWHSVPYAGRCRRAISFIYSERAHDTQQDGLKH